MEIGLKMGFASTASYSEERKMATSESQCYIIFATKYRKSAHEQLPKHSESSAGFVNVE